MDYGVKISQLDADVMSNIKKESKAVSLEGKAHIADCQANSYKKNR